MMSFVQLMTDAHLGDWRFRMLVGVTRSDLWVVSIPYINEGYLSAFW